MKIKKLQSDRGIELKTLKFQLFQSEYKKRITCSYTPSHNGVVEHRNRHIIKMGLFMMIRGIALEMWTMVLKLPYSNLAKKYLLNFDTKLNLVIPILEFLGVYITLILMLIQPPKLILDLNPLCF